MPEKYKINRTTIKGDEFHKITLELEDNNFTIDYNPDRKELEINTGLDSLVILPSCSNQIKIKSGKKL